MARGFRRKGSGERARYAAQLDPLERATIAGLMDQVRELLDPPAPVPEGGDDFASIVAGLGMGVTLAAEDQRDLAASDAERDPALDRLLPTANRQDDEMAAEFRRLTETGLRQRKAAALQTAADLMRGEDKLRLDDGQAHAVLEAVAEDLDPDDPLGYALAVYDFLTWLQETLSSAMLDA